MGTLYQHKDIHKVTWRSHDNKMCNQIDHILVDRRQCRNVCDDRSVTAAETQSDHFLVRAKIRLKIKSRYKTKKREIKRWDIGKINTKDIKENFFKEVTVNIQNTQRDETEVINKIWNKIKKVINEAAGKITGKEETPLRNSWFEEGCQIILLDKTTIYNKMINRNTRQNKQEYKDKRKEEHKIF